MREGRAGCPQVRLSTGAPSPRRLSFRARVAQFARASPRQYYTLDSQLESVIMLIGLVRDSVMQCFCHSCRAPVLPAGWKRLRTSLLRRTKHQHRRHYYCCRDEPPNKLILFTRKEHDLFNIYIINIFLISKYQFNIIDIKGDSSFLTRHKIVFIFCNKIIFVIYYYYF